MEEISYERRVYESVQDESISGKQKKSGHKWVHTCLFKLIIGHPNVTFYVISMKNGNKIIFKHNCVIFFIYLFYNFSSSRNKKTHIRE